MLTKVLQRWHLLSLDAPTVAALWTWFIARCCGIALPASAIAAMFLAVWMLYAADRLLDARLLDARLLDARLLNARLLDARLFDFALSRDIPDLLEARHHFHHRHRRAFLSFIVIAALALAALLPTLHPEALRLYALLASLLFAWFLLIHLRLAQSSRLPKEIAVAIFFPAAAFISTVARRPDLRAGLLLPAFLFAAICALNCLYLYAWEHPDDRTQAHWTTRLATRHITLFTTLTTALSLSCLFLHASTFAVPVAFPAACAATAVLLLALNVNRHKLAPLTLRAAADLALLTPVLFLR